MCDGAALPSHFFLFLLSFSSSFSDLKGQIGGKVFGGCGRGSEPREHTYIWPKEQQSSIPYSFPFCSSVSCTQARTNKRRAPTLTRTDSPSHSHTPTSQTSHTPTPRFRRTVRPFPQLLPFFLLLSSTLQIMENHIHLEKKKPSEEIPGHA